MEELGVIHLKIPDNPTEEELDILMDALVEIIIAQPKEEITLGYQRDPGDETDYK